MGKAQTDAGASGDAGASSDAGAVDADAAALIAEGVVVFTTTSVPPYGNVGCQYCHCPDATGGCNLGAPRIAGKTRPEVANALQSVTEMSVIILSERQIDAVAAFLATK